MTTLIAVDGGNSKTDVVLLNSEGEILARGRGGAFLPQSEGVAPATDVIEVVVRQALGFDGRADHLVAFLAGADLPEEEVALEHEISGRGLARQVLVRNDTFALLRSGASGPWGVAVVCGAGINAVGVAPDGSVARFPSLGPISGDWGGGGGLSAETLWHAVRAEDGRGAPTELAALVKSHFGAATVEQVALDLHFGRLERERLLELTPGLFKVAAAGDEIAVSLVTRMADEVMAMAGVCLKRLDLLRTPTEVVLGGGVLRARDPLLTALLDERFAERAPLATQIIAELPPIAGAALAALDRIGASEEAKARLREQF
ncbi:N-acetylglucosamine kinase [Nonomuraea soli]|uniref:N-acetylglucosamine kinase-like BadF-type ATPase n=1 Tax=Nonomuraea soli TaxID=1032476 RepID=A0A7W0CSV6_9ACTN|nr:BadF/BadG/BcrA/BcrD ATPase family protein [Nonomuraea soli]MBA2896698.1 N-acetylglucosamine kinase-like BadF-type ATPase [Nonomuraea soli]